MLESSSDRIVCHYLSRVESTCTFLFYVGTRPMPIAKRRHPGKRGIDAAITGDRDHVASSSSASGADRSRSAGCGKAGAVAAVAAAVVLTFVLFTTGWFLLSGISISESSIDVTADVLSDVHAGTWDEQFSLLDSFDPSSPSPPPQQQHQDSKFDVLYYHVRKAGGSSIYQMFERFNRKYGNPPNPGKVGCCGQELPGHLNRFLSWRNRDNKNRLGEQSSFSKPSKAHRRKPERLLVMSFREPIERTISHYFYAKPCPDGTGGGMNDECRKAAQRGVDAFLAVCKFARNWQYQYLDTNMDNIEKIDFVLPVDRVDEAIVLFAAKYNVPIQHLFYTHKKVAMSGANFQDRNEKGDGGVGEKKTFACAAQWIKKLVPADKLQQYNETTCGKACAGKIGRLAFTDRQLRRMQTMNTDDIILWRKVSCRYDEERQGLLAKYGITEKDLEATVLQYQKSRQRFEEYLEVAQGKIKR